MSYACHIPEEEWESVPGCSSLNPGGQADGNNFQCIFLTKYKLISPFINNGQMFVTFF